MWPEDLYIKGFAVPFIRSHEADYHSHTYMELSYVLSGKGTHTINGIKTELRKGDYFFINPNSFHQDILENDGNEEAAMITCVFFPYFIDPLLKNCTNLSELLFHFGIFINSSDQSDESLPILDPLTRYYHDDDGFVGQLFMQMCREYYNDDIGSEQIIRNNIINILIVLMRKHNLLSKDSHDDPFAIILNYMQKNYMNNVTLDVASKLVGYSPQYISMHFAEKTGGDSFKLTLRKIRIRQACRLLVTTNTPISEIIGLVGYKDVKTFYETFREITNMSPLQYQKSSKNSNLIPLPPDK